MSTPNNPEFWKDENNLIKYLASELIKGRLCLFLGAGVSIDSGLPDWRTLVDRICEAVGEPTLNATEDPTKKIAAIKLKKFKKDNKRLAFLETTHKALFSDFDGSFENLRKQDLLSAVAAITIAANSIYSPKIITLNYDNLLELYLEYYGCLVSSVYTEHHWSTPSDVTVYHPHGFLPYFQEDQKSAEIVFEENDYMNILKSNYWKPLLETVLRTHTTIYVGMSGDDMHLRTLLTSMKDLHAIKHERVIKHGIFVKRGDTSQPSDDDLILSEMGVQIHNVSNYSDVPKFLFQISQHARKMKLDALQST